MITKTNRIADVQTDTETPERTQTINRELLDGIHAHFTVPENPAAAVPENGSETVSVSELRNRLPEPIRDRFDHSYLLEPGQAQERDDGKGTDGLEEFSLELARGIKHGDFPRANAFAARGGVPLVSELMNFYRNLEKDAAAVVEAHEQWFARVIHCSHRYYEQAPGQSVQTLTTSETFNYDWSTRIPSMQFPTIKELFPKLAMGRFTRARNPHELQRNIDVVWNGFCLNLARAETELFCWGVENFLFGVLHWHKEMRTAWYQYYTREHVRARTATTSGQRSNFLGRSTPTVEQRDTARFVTHKHALMDVRRWEYLDVLNAGPNLTIPVEIEKAMLAAPESLRSFISVFEGKQPYELKIAEDVSVDITQGRMSQREEEAFLASFPCEPALVIGNCWALLGWNAEDIEHEVKRRKTIRGRQRELGALRIAHQQQRERAQRQLEDATPQNRIPTVVFIFLPALALYAFLQVPPEVVPLEHLFYALVGTVVVSGLVILHRIARWFSLPSKAQIRLVQSVEETRLAEQELELQRQILELGEETPEVVR